MLKSKKLLLVSVFLSLGMFFFQSKPASAASCGDFALSVTNAPPSQVSCQSAIAPFTVTINSGTNLFDPSATYKLNRGVGNTIVQNPPTNSHSVSFTVNTFPLQADMSYVFQLDGPNFPPAGCRVFEVNTDSAALTASVYITQNRGQMCYGFPGGCLEAGTPLSVEVRNVKQCGQFYANKHIRIKIEGTSFNPEVYTDATGSVTATTTIADPGIYKLLVEDLAGINSNILDRTPFTVVAPGTCTSCQTTEPTGSGTGGHQDYKICDQISDTLETSTGANAKERCIQCVGGDELGRAGIWTAIGCIPRSPEKIVNSLLRVGLGVGGGFSLIIILVSGFILSVSQGEPKRIDEAKQWLTSALVGLLFIIFSVTLLHFIGYTIFKIPGFGG